MKITLQCLRSLQQKGANLNVGHTTYFDDKTALELGLPSATHTPLAFAICSKKTELVQKLLEWGADVNGMGTMGSPFQAAVACGNIAILPTLLAWKADINLKDEWGQTALFGVLYHKEAHSFNFLYSCSDLDCTVQDNEGQTPLHFEIKQGSPSVDIVRKLLARGANPHIKNRLGKTPLDYAREGKYTNIVAILEGKEPNIDNFLTNTILSVQHKRSIAKKGVKKPVAKNKKVVKAISPKKRTESEVEIQQLSPTKKLRDAFDNFTLDVVDSKARKALTFSDDTFDHNDAGQGDALVQVPEVTFEQLAPRVQDWFNPEFLADQKNKAYSLNEFARSVYYHQLPIEVLKCVLTHGKPEAHASKKHPEDVGTRYYLRGEMVFENQCDNPWTQGRKCQPGYYHCTMNGSGQIYHVGFDAIKDGQQSFASLFATKKLSFNGMIDGITHSFII